MPYIVLDPATAQAAPAGSIGAPLTSVGETLDSLLEELSLESGERSEITDTRNKRFINWAYRNLCGMLDLSQLRASFGITSTAAQPFYLLPANVAYLTRVSYTNELLVDGGAQLAMIDEPSYRDLPDTDDAEPQLYFRYLNMIVLYPAPSQAWDFTVDAKIRPADLSNPTDSPIVPVEFHEGLLHMSRARLFRATRQAAQAIQAQNDALAIIRPLLNNDAEELNSAEFSLAPARKWSTMRGTKGV